MHYNLFCTLYFELYKYIKQIKKNVYNMLNE